MKFFKNKNKHYLKKIVKNPKKENEISMHEILQNVEEIILKIDIEGSEYDILQDITKNSKKLISLVIEFHDLQNNLDKIKNFIIENKSLKLIHIHGNNWKDIDSDGNPNDVELTFVNIEKINVTNEKSEKKYPIPGIDYKNFKRKNDIQLNFHD